MKISDFLEFEQLNICTYENRPFVGDPFARYCSENQNCMSELAEIVLHWCWYAKFSTNQTVGLK